MEPVSQDSDFPYRKNIRLDIEYDGTDFYGWQRQRGVLPTLQGTLEAALCRVLRQQIVITAAGRTDRGVHARFQVVNFMAESPIGLFRMVHSLNCLLPVSVRVIVARFVAPDFHARFSAREREYRYFLLERPSALRQRFTGCSNGALDIVPMRRAARLLYGEHDFRAFAKEPAERPSTFCRVTACTWERYDDDTLVFTVRANRFLRSMMRMLVSAMSAVGRNKMAPGDILLALRSGRLPMPLIPAEPSGLFLWEVSY